MQKNLLPSVRIGSQWVVLQLALLLAQSLSAAVTFTVTPAAVSNTYAGVITLQVTGLASGDTVVVQKFLDANGNGVIDAADWLAQQFTLTDGQAGMVIGGVTNFNVPGDTDTTAGQITANLNFRNGDFMQNAAGTYLYKLSSPANHFTPLTAALTVTAFPYGQKFTGTVRCNGAAVPYASVIVTPGSHGNPVAGTLANASGVYTLPAPPGGYLPLAFKSGYVVNPGTASGYTLNSGQTVNADLTLAAATSTISGKVVDAANSSVALACVLLEAETETGLMAVGSTDASGNFSLGVQAGQWGVRAADTSLIIHGYAGLQDRTGVNAGAAGVAVAVPKATALMYGRVQDTHGNPILGIDVYANDSNNNLWETDGYTDLNGNYFLALPSGMAWVEADVDHQASNYVFPDGQSYTLANGQATLANFTALTAGRSITGTLKDNNGQPIGGVGIWASATVNGVDFQTQADTDSAGNYTLHVTGGASWDVGVNNCNDCSDGLPGSYVCPSTQKVDMNNSDAVINFVALAATTHITGTLKNNSNQPLGGVGIWANATINGVSFQVQADTDGNGNFSLGVANGTWTVGVASCDNCNDSLPSNYSVPDAQTVTVNNNAPTVNFTVQPGQPLQITTSWLPDGTVGTSYSQSLQATGGHPPYQWGWPAQPGNIPPGLNLSSDGTLSGNPSNVGTFTFTVQAYDNFSSADSTTQTLTLTINPGSPLQITSSWLPDGTNGLFYLEDLQASGGAAPYSWSIPAFSAALPPNLTLSTNGTLSGTPATTGTFYFDVVVTDSLGATAEQDGMSLNVANPPPPPLAITNVSLPGGSVGAAYNAQLGATGGQPPYVWSLALGSAGLPPGLTLGTNGLISGTPTTNKVFGFKVQVTDAAFTTTSQILSITISAGCSLSSPGWLGSEFQMWLNGATGVNYTVQMSTDLSSTNWTSLFVTNSATANSFMVIDPNATDQQRFYRVKVGP
ncbi:MAG: putative Ig domain-containing protein [Verrucomicrobiota bacterium]